MNLRPEQLAAQLDKPLAPLYVLHGNEPLLVLEAGDAIRAAARKQGYAEREVLVAGQGFRWSELQSAAGNLSLFGASKLVDLRIPNGKPGREGGEALQRYARQLDDGVVTLVTLPELDWATRKAAWFVALAEAGIAVELNAPERERLPDWIAQRLARQQQRAPAEALGFIADHVEGNLLAAHQEILKLGLLHPPGDLSLDDVRGALVACLSLVELLGLDADTILRRLFWEDEFSLGKTQRALERQSGGYPEHSRFRLGPVLFVTLNLPGGNNNRGLTSEARPEFLARNPVVLAWLRDSFNLANREQLAGIVLLFQANPGFAHFAQGFPHRGYREFLNALQEESLKFPGKVLAVHGDTHISRIDQPMRDRDGRTNFRFTRVETHGYPQMGWTLGVIDTDLPTLFRFETHAWPAKNP